MSKEKPTPKKERSPEQEAFIQAKWLSMLADIEEITRTVSEPEIRNCSNDGTNEESDPYWELIGPRWEDKI